MRIRNQRSIKAISLAVLAIGAIYLAFVYYRTISMLWFNEAPDRIVWNQGQMGWQIAVLAGYLLGWTAVFSLGVLVECNIFKGLKSGDLFPKKNIPLIMSASVLIGVSIFFGANVPDVMRGVECSVLDSNCIFVPLVVIVFGLLYKQASLAIEDSNLAI